MRARVLTLSLLAAGLLLTLGLAVAYACRGQDAIACEWGIAAALLLPPVCETIRTREK